MVLGVSSLGNLQSVFGAAATSEVTNAIERWRLSVQGDGHAAEVVYVDDANSLSAFGVAPGGGAPGVDPYLIRNTLKEIERLSARPIESVVLLGGPRIVPHFIETNPVQSRVIDPDTTLATDLPYGEGLTASPLVGRLPDDGTSSAASLKTLLENTINCRISRPFAQGSFALLNAEWAGPSAQFVGNLDQPATLRIAPAWALTIQRLPELRVRYLHFNLHGFTDQAEWKGFDPERAEFVSSIAPASLLAGQFPAPLIFCTNCYGGVLEGLTSKRSCALSFLARGAVQLIAATGTVFGSRFGSGLDSGSAVEFGDRLAISFWEAIRAGRPGGAALQDALSQFAGDNNAYAQKTRRQFLFLGDPTLN